MIRSRHHTKIIVLISLLVVAIGALVTTLVLRSTTPYANIDIVESKSHLGVVLPNPLPGGTRVVDQPTYNSSIRSIFTRFIVEGNEVTFSQQARPETNLKQVDAQDTFLIAAGSVYILKGESGRLQAIVETADSWIMVNADAKLGKTRFKELLNNLNPI